MVDSFYSSSVPPLAWGCDLVQHVEYEKLLEDPTMFAVMPVSHPAIIHALEPSKYLDPSAHIYTVSCEELETMMNWDHLLRPIVAPLVPSESAAESPADSPCDTSASDAETGKRCTPEPTKQTRASRKRSESGSFTECASPTSPSPKRRRGSSKSSEFVPIVKSKRARALELMMKRDNHNDSERQRRCEMKDGLNALKSALPAMKGMSRMNTSQLLEYAISYIKDVVDEEQRLLADKESLRSENEKLLGAAL